MIEIKDMRVHRSLADVLFFCTLCSLENEITEMKCAVEATPPTEKKEKEKKNPRLALGPFSVDM